MTKFFHGPNDGAAIGGDLPERPAREDLALEDLPFTTADRQALTSCLERETSCFKARWLFDRIARPNLSGDSEEWGNMSPKQLTDFFQSQALRKWVQAETASGHQVIWLTGLNKTMAVGHACTFFFAFRAEKQYFTLEHNDLMRDFLFRHGLLSGKGKELVSRFSASENARLILQLWKRDEVNGSDLFMKAFWREPYWLTLKGVAQAQKQKWITEFAPTYTEMIYPGILEVNQARTEAGIHPVIISDDDEEVLCGIAPFFGIPSANARGTNGIYKGGISTGRRREIEVLEDQFCRRTQDDQGRIFERLARFLKDQDGIPIIAGFDGSLFDGDGGALALLNPKITCCVVDTPGFHDQGRYRAFRDKADLRLRNRSGFFTRLKLQAPPAFPNDPFPPIANDPLDEELLEQ